MKLKILAAAAAVALGATSAQAVSFTTFDGGEHDAIEIGAVTPATGIFFDTYEFTLSSLSSLTATFASTGVVGSFGIYKADDTPLYSWGVGGTSFTTSGSFNLDAGSYYYAVLGNGTAASGYTLTSTVAAVPEPETYAMLAAGLGIIGFLSSRRRNSR